jgi:uncharacterized protein (DUF362 family)
MKYNALDRRNFLKMSLMGGATLAMPWSATRTMAAADAPPAGAPGARGPRRGAPQGGPAVPPVSYADKLPSRVGLAAGEDRADITFQALKPFSKEITAAIGNKRVVVKPNLLVTNNQLAATDAKNLEGILEFLKSIGKDGNVLIIESPAMGPAQTGYVNYGYDKVAAKYGAKLAELDQDEIETIWCYNDMDFRPHPCRVGKTLLDPNNFIISAAKLKTHDRVVATLSLKNIVLGSAIKRPGGDPIDAYLGASDKPIMHGGSIRGSNFNLAVLAQRLHPNLAVIDGYEGMEGQGPGRGTPVNSRVCVASLDWLAADRVGVELMGIDFAKVGYLNYCANMGLGQADLSKIEIVGPAIKDHVKPYKMPANFEEQLIWMKPVT